MDKEKLEYLQSKALDIRKLTVEMIGRLGVGHIGDGGDKFFDIHSDTRRRRNRTGYSERMGKRKSQVLFYNRSYGGNICCGIDMFVYIQQTYGVCNARLFVSSKTRYVRENAVASHKIFDTNTHGDIMSCYTNDTDAIRQLISQSLPQAYAAW